MIIWSASLQRCHQLLEYLSIKNDTADVSNTYQWSAPGYIIGNSAILGYKVYQLQWTVTAHQHSYQGLVNTPLLPP